MSIVLYINELVKWNSGQENEQTERILWIDSGGYVLYTIDIFAKEGFPILKRIDEIVNSIESGEAQKLEDDVMIRLINEDDIKVADKEKRDKAWAIIADIVSNEPDIYARAKRGPWISELVLKHGVTYSTIYKYLRRYWQRGKNKNSLLPDYYNSGGKGKRKKLSDKKVGRPKKNPEVNGPGMNVDEETKKTFRIAISWYYDNPKENNFSKAYELMVKEFYSEDYSFENGVRRPLIVPIEKIPSIYQFRYWYETEHNIVKSLNNRKGAKKFALQHRAVLGRSDSEIVGPGSMYQIDATVADVYLVSRFNRTWIIGRPVVYAVLDCFSRIVAGIYVGLEGPSWIGAMMALSNAFIEKTGFCKEYGINIESEDWPYFHIPQAILGDRGEMESRHADTLVNGLGIRIENTPPYRGDWKGIVEQYFHLIDEQVRPLVPGHIDIDFRERGGKDYRLDAKLDIYQFTQIIIRCVLFHNNHHWMENYQSYEMMIEDDVDLIPIELWNWGIINRSGKLKAYPKDTVRLNLMPADTATVTEKGIKFKKMFYSCQNAINENWFELARNKDSWKEIIAYDPRDMDYIYLKGEDGKSFIKCSMIDKRRYGNKTYDEIQNLINNEKVKLERNAGKILQSKVDILSEVEAITEQAEQMTNEQTDKSVSNSERTRNIREKRKLEKEIERKTSSFELDEAKKSDSPAKIIPLHEDDEDKFKYPSNIEYLKKKQRERMIKQNEEKS